MDLHTKFATIDAKFAEDSTHLTTVEAALTTIGKKADAVEAELRANNKFASFAPHLTINSSVLILKYVRYLK